MIHNNMTTLSNLIFGITGQLAPMQGWSQDPNNMFNLPSLEAAEKAVGINQKDWPRLLAEELKNPTLKMGDNGTGDRLEGKGGPIGKHLKDLTYLTRCARHMVEPILTELAKIDLTKATQELKDKVAFLIRNLQIQTPIATA